MSQPLSHTHVRLTPAELTEAVVDWIIKHKKNDGLEFHITSATVDDSEGRQWLRAEWGVGQAPACFECRRNRSQPSRN